MFKHAKTPPAENIKTDNSKLDVAPTPVIVVPDKNKSAPTPGHEGVLKELIEKNLKWSQIIYEQNRKINSKLMWMAIASWVKLALILVPLILAIFFLPPLLKGVLSQYGELLGAGSVDSNQKMNSFDSVIKLLNLDPAKQEQLKALLK